MPFNAYFLADSDPDFRITPQSGELLPPDANGTLLKVLFTPHKYGKIYQGKLVIQVHFSDTSGIIICFNNRYFIRNELLDNFFFQVRERHVVRMYFNDMALFAESRYAVDVQCPWHFA